jgi:anhydro-N-acetylmuramic acid kinase
MLAIGLMSGTSMDAIDGVLCRFDNGHWQGLVATHSQSYPAALREQLLPLQSRDDVRITVTEWAALDEAVAVCFADTANELLRCAKVDRSAVGVLGSHGQTVFHDPQGIGSSLQLGNPSRIAALTGIDTVADFRRADIALGGHGAPLVPAFHHALFATADEVRCVLNLGGIANITVLPDASPGQVRGFDTGPGNALMDEWSLTQQGQALDLGGRWAASGQCHQPLLQALLADPYLHRPPPKSTGRDYFNLAWARRRFPALDQLPAADVQRSFCELTARSVIAAIAQHAPTIQRLLVCGGGARNDFLISLLRQLLPQAQLETTQTQGLDEAWVEGAAFAWLAVQRLLGRPGNLPAVTGASRAAILGGIYRA